MEFKFQQTGFYAPDLDLAKEHFKVLGCKKWEDDIVTAEGLINGRPGRNVAHLSFNYDLGTELELICYLDGDNWHADSGRLTGDKPFLSHISYHVTDIEQAKIPLLRAGFIIAQDVYTLTHTNPYLISIGRKFHYVVFHSRASLGFDVKLIQRIEK